MIESFAERVCEMNCLLLKTNRNAAQFMNRASIIRGESLRNELFIGETNRDAAQFMNRASINLQWLEENTCTAYAMFTCRCRFT